MAITTTSTSIFYSTASQQLAKLQAQATQVQASISTGNRFANASEDPLAASQMRLLSLADAAAKVDGDSANKVLSDLKLADSAMTQITNTITRAQQLAQQAANGALSNANRASVGAELSEIVTTLVGLANARDSDGNALFGGGIAGQAYTLDSSGNPVYGGAAQSASLSIGNGQTMARSVTGPQMLGFTNTAGASTDVIATIKTLADTLKAGGSGAATAANAALTDLSSGLAAVSTAQTVVGARETWITQTLQNQTAQQEARTADESRIGDTDVSAAVIKLQQLTTALQASQASFVRLSSLSLFDVLK